MISAYNPQVYQDKPIQYNYKIDGVNRLLQLKNSLYEQNYEYIKGLKSSTLGIHFLNENGNKEVKTIQDNVDNFFKTHDINKYDVGDAAIANEFTNQFKSLESNRSLQELYRVDKALQQDLSSVNSLRTDKDRAKKGYATDNHELFALRLEEYSKLDKSTAIARGAESFRYVPYTNPIPDITSIQKMVPIIKRDTIVNGQIITEIGRDPLDIYRALNEMLPEGAKKQLAVAGELEARRALKNGGTVEQLYKTAILPRTSPILMDNIKRLKELNIELNSAIAGGEPKKEAEAKAKISDITQKIEKIKSDTDMSVINKMSQDQFINYYGQISVDHQLEHISSSFGKINQTFNMAALALKQKDDHFRATLMQNERFHKDDNYFKELGLKLKQKELGIGEPSQDGLLGPTIPATANASADLTYDLFNKAHADITKDTERLQDKPEVLVGMVNDGSISKSSNVYAKAFNIYLNDPIAKRLPLSIKEKVQVFSSMLNKIEKGDYEGNTELKNEMYKVLRPSLNYKKMYDAKWNEQVKQQNRAILGLDSSELLTESKFNEIARAKGISTKYNNGKQEAYISKISLGTQQSISNNYTVTVPEVENPRKSVGKLPKATTDAMAVNYHNVLTNSSRLISAQKVKGDENQITDLTDLTKSIKVTPHGYLYTFVDDKSKTEISDGDEGVTEGVSITKGKYVITKEGAKIPLDEGPQLIPYPIEDRNKYMDNMTIANSTRLKPLEHRYKGKTLIMYNDNGFKYTTDIPDATSQRGATIDLTSKLMGLDDPITAFETFVNTLNK